VWEKEEVCHIRFISCLVMQCHLLWSSPSLCTYRLLNRTLYLNATHYKFKATIDKSPLFYCTLICNNFYLHWVQLLKIIIGNFNSLFAWFWKYLNRHGFENPNQLFRYNFRLEISLVIINNTTQPSTESLWIHRNLNKYFIESWLVISYLTL
jgi:hypothetical protein